MRDSFNGLGLHLGNLSRLSNAETRSITMENIGLEGMTIFYQINYTLTDVPADAAYFHAQFRRTNWKSSSVASGTDPVESRSAT